MKQNEEEKKDDIVEEEQTQEEQQESQSIKIPDTNDEKYIRLGMAVVFVVFIIIGIWSATAELQTGVPCPGQVVVESNKKTIQSLAGGIIEKIYVKDGDFVNKGDKLIMFDTTKSRSELDSLLANYYEALALKDRLVAENRRLKSIRFSKELDELPMKKRQEITQRQIDTFKHETEYIHKQEISAKQKINSLQKHIKALQESIEKKTALLDSYHKEVAEQEDLLSQGLVDKNRLTDAKRKIINIQNDILSNKSEIQKNYIDIESAKNDLALSEEKFFTDVNTQLSKVQTSIADMEAKMRNLRDKLDQTLLRSPVDGVVMNLAYHTIGAVVSPGKPIMDIVPSNAKLIIEAKLQPAFIEYVKVGEKAKLTFPAFSMDSQFIDTIEGEVIFVSADTTTDKEGHSFYTVKLRVDEEGKKVLEKHNLKLLAGMPASATIIAGKQTTLEYLLKPMSKMLEKAFLEK